MSLNDIKQYWSLLRVKIKDIHVSSDKSLLSVILVSNNVLL